MIYTTTDLYFASTLRALNIEFTGLGYLDDQKREFRFEIEESEINDIKNRYYLRNLPVDAKSLIEAIKEMKARIYAD